MKAYPGAKGTSIRGYPQAFAVSASATDAGTARVLAHSRKAAISSARVVERGTVWVKASTSNCVFSAFFSEYAAYNAPCTAASISAPEYPLAAAATLSRSKSAGLRLRFASWITNICFRSAWFGKSTKNNSSNRPLRISSGGSTVTLLQVAATKTGDFRSCIHDKNDASSREETPASADAESGPLPANTFSNSSIHNTQGASPSATWNTLRIRFSVSPMYLSYTPEVSNFTSGSFHSPATARAHRDLPQPCTPRMIIPFGASRPNSRAESSHAPFRCPNQCFRFSKPPTVPILSEASINSSIPECRSSCFLASRTSVTVSGQSAYRVTRACDTARSASSSVSPRRLADIASTPAASNSSFRV